MSETTNQNPTIQDEVVVSLEYTLQVEGEIVDSTGEDEHIQFIQGHGQIIPGLESQLYGMTSGESKEVTVPPEDAYGVLDDDALGTVPRDEFPPDMPLEKGVALQLRDEDGEVFDAYVESVGKKSVEINLNHPLAGKELHFSVKVLDLRPASEDEIAHGHVHD
jgi:FKBP-type peptidyl-prolyl cis-trans isomerase SlyD